MRKIMCFMFVAITLLPLGFPIVLGNPVIAAQITRVEYSTGNAFLQYGYLGQLGPGQEVQVRVTVKNRGSASHTFWVGISFKDSKGYQKGHYDVQPKQLYLDCGWLSSITGCAERSATFKWRLPSPPNEAHGAIWLAVGVWEGFNSDLMIRPQYAYQDWFKIGNSYFS